MINKVCSILILWFLVKGNFADPFHFNVPDPVDPFVGRQDFLQILHETLTRKVVVDDIQLSSITFVTGRGGIGKTETTRKYIQTYSDAFENVIWIEAENELTLENSFRSLAKSKIISDNVQIESESSDTKSESVNQIQEKNRNHQNSKNHSKMKDDIIQNIYQVLGRDKRKTLMIFDNVDSIPWKFFPSDLHKNSNEISDGENDLIPPSILLLRKKGQSSSGKGQQQMDSVKWLPLAPFTDDDNINYILQYPNLRSTSDDMPEVKVIENARLLGQLLGGVPLALKQAMAFISISFKKHPEKGLEKYLNLYKELKEKNGNDAESSSSAVSSTSEPESTTLNPIFLTWTLTKEKFSQEFQGNFTTLLMDCLPYFPSSKMSIRLLFHIFLGEKVSFQDQRVSLFKKAIHILHRYAIVNIDRNQSDPKVDRKQSDPKVDRNQSDPKVDLDLDLVGGTLSMHRELQRAVLKVFKKQEIHLEIHGLPQTTTTFVRMAAWLLVKSEEFLDKVIEENKRLSLSELYSLATILDRLESSVEHSRDGRPDIRMLKIVSITRFKVAFHFQKLQNFEGEENCRKLLQHSLTKLKQVETESESTLTDFELQRQIIELVEKIYIPPMDHGREGQKKTVDRNLALKALHLQEMLLEVATEILGENHPFRLACLDKMADAMWRIESPPSFRQDALALYHQVYEASEMFFGKENQKILLPLHKLAEIYSNLNEFPKSLELYTQILRLEENIFGTSSPQTMFTMKNMAAVLGNLGHYEKALKLSKSLVNAEQKKNQIMDFIKQHVADDSANGNGETSGEMSKCREQSENVDMALQHNMAVNHVKLENHLEAYKIWEKLYNKNLKKYGPDDLRSVAHESEMARVLYTLKEYEKALKMQLHVHEIREKILGPNDRSTIDTKLDLANLYHEQGNVEKALELFTLVYNFRRKTLGEENEYTIRTLDKLADVHQQLKNKKLAHKIKTQIYTTQKKLFGEESLEAINALQGLAVSTASLGEGQNNPESRKRILKMFQKVYNVKKKILGLTHDRTLLAHFTLAHFQAVSGDPAKSIKQLEATYNAIANNPDQGPDSTPALQTLYAMSKIRLVQGKHGLALKLAHKVMEAYKRTLGPDHPTTVKHLGEIGALYFSQQNYGDALKYYDKSHSIMTKIYGAEHPKAQGTLEILGVIYMKQQNYEQANAIYRTMYEFRARTLGEGHLSTITALLSLGVIAKEVGLYPEAIVIFTEVLRGRVAIFGQGDEETLVVMDTLAQSYTYDQNFEEALKTYVLTYQGRKVTLGEEHEHTIGTLENISLCYFELGNLDKALKIVSKAYEQRVKIQGQNHERTKRALEMKKKFSSDLNLKQKTEL